ncbi:hypothetical protein TARUN_2275 [Trichoderma arundinaceum]|uniref:Aga1 a-agglutinin anchor subunit n=1 Tax=Trichoderma arundinaceum TaxID=490622 RepID=A0A395NWR6_TRIAR|nr:hypothetical protein TARUN_2275 [Trichoderma arundinaceum]
MSSSIPRSRSVRSNTGIPSIPTRTSSTRDPSEPRTISPTRLPSLKHGARAVSVASSSSSSTTSLKNTATNSSSTARAPTASGIPGRLTRSMTMATKEVAARKEKAASGNKYPPSTTVTRPSIQTRGRSASISMPGKPKELERRPTGLAFARSSATNLAAPTAVKSTSRSRDPIRRPLTPTAQTGIPTTTRRSATPTALTRSNTFSAAGRSVTPTATKAQTPPSNRAKTPPVGLTRAATFSISAAAARAATRSATRPTTPTTTRSGNSAASSRAATPTAPPRTLERRAPSTEKMTTSTTTTTKSRKPSLATLSKVVSRLAKRSSAGTMLSQDQASQVKPRPSIPSIQRPASPGKSLAAKPSASHLPPPSPSRLPANIAASAEVSKLQAELLQLYLLHQEAPVVDAEWRASARQKLGDRFARLSEESREVAEQESVGLEKRNVLALRRWGSGGRLDEKIQSLESIITNVWSLSDPGGRYARVVRHFERWIDGVSEMEDARRRGVVLVQGDDSLFIEDLDAQWKEEREDLIHRLDEWKQQLHDIDDLSLDEFYSEPPDEDEKSSLEKMLDGSRSLIDDMLAELRIMEVIEQEALVREDEWISRMNRSDDDDYFGISHAGGAWKEM